MKIEPNLFFKLIFYLVMVCLLYSCTESPSSREFEPLSFEIDSLMLDQPFLADSLGFGFSPPAGWKAVAPELLTDFRSSLIGVGPDSLVLEITLEQVFMDLDNSSFLFFNSFPATEKPDSVSQVFHNLMSEKLSSEFLKTGTFSHRDLDFYQFINTSDNKVAIKLITSSGSDQVVMFDYIMPFSIYEKRVKAIESSIGSIAEI